jgi:hypothetical protein
VSDLTINNVHINAGENKFVGAITGKGGTLKNCKVILNGTSEIIANENVGGISGAEAIISGCEVKSEVSTAVIKGIHCVGGIIGYTSSVIADSHVSCNIEGATEVGGVVAYTSSEIRNCSFEGTLTGEDGVGGIVGLSGGSISSCRVNATISASNGNAGGIVGDTGTYSKIYACYSAGNISASGNCSGLACQAYSYLSYTVMASSSSSYYGLGKYVYGYDCATAASSASNSTSNNVLANCTDITNFLKNTHSEYSEYWSFDNNWTWNGKVNGSNVNIRCPKLSWEY